MLQRNCHHKNLHTCTYWSVYRFLHKTLCNYPYIRLMHIALYILLGMLNYKF